MIDLKVLYCVFDSPHLKRRTKMKQNILYVCQQWYMVLKWTGVLSLLPNQKKNKNDLCNFLFFFFKTEMNSWHQWLSCEHQTLVWRRTLLEKHSVIKTGCSSIPEVSSTRLTIGVTLEKWYLMMSFYVLHRKRRKAHTCIHQWESGCSFRKENPQTNIAKLDLDCYILALPIRWGWDSLTELEICKFLKSKRQNSRLAEDQI